MKSDNKTIRAMQLVIPAMILCFIGDYCIGIEPADSTSLDSIASSGWLTIADWRIAVSNSFGMIGSLLYAIGAVAFVKFLLEQKDKLEQSVDKVWLNLYIASLGLGCVSFMYFHIKPFREAGLKNRMIRQRRDMTSSGGTGIQPAPPGRSLILTVRRCRRQI